MEILRLAGIAIHCFLRKAITSSGSTPASVRSDSNPLGPSLGTDILQGDSPWVTFLPPFDGTPALPASVSVSD